MSPDFRHASGAVTGYVLSPGQGLSARPDEPGTKASAASTAGSLTVIESTLTSGPPRHVHDREDESFYILDGSLTAYCGADVLPAEPGSFVFLPRRIPHHFTVDTPTVTLLLVVTPAGIEDYFREIAAAPDEPARRVVRDRYGIHRA
jgi:mannose-6-phosphate isomerase-like protein (cupin superfamily)